ncbi:MAG: VanZ family protein [Candidatus Scalindua rubra]|uniref:VanZ like family protein n=1 Tax=Candidatus Scalindua brodae TaxID=237368 RepID=A0A0B0ERY2_9BACT|nr:MAG: VanZ like family protein [Candidatus Scalindua brodae]MBZ0110313.1 VanZ family protein [Candidatus Scalindua rubra]
MRKLIICFYVLYVLVITYFSLTPIAHKISESIWDKTAHFIAYLILVIFIRMVHVRFNYLTCIITCFSYSFIIECIQYFVPNRMFDILDMLANVLGAVLGAIIYYLIIENRNGIKQ